MRMTWTRYRTVNNCHEQGQFPSIPRTMLWGKHWESPDLSQSHSWFSVEPGLLNPRGFFITPRKRKKSSAHESQDALLVPVCSASFERWDCLTFLYKGLPLGNANYCLLKWTFYLTSLLDFISVCCDKMPWQEKQLRGLGVYFSSRFHDTVCGGRWVEAVGPWDSWSYHTQSQSRVK